MSSVTAPAHHPIAIVRPRPKTGVYLAFSLAIIFTPCVLGALTLLAHR